MLMFQEKNSIVHELIRHATRSVYKSKFFKKNEIQTFFLTQNVDNTPVCMITIHTGVLSTFLVIMNMYDHYTYRCIINIFWSK